MKVIKIIIACLTIISCQSLKGQTHLEPLLSDAEYKVINDLYGNEVKLYSETDFSKTWSYLMHPRHLEALYGPPCIDGKEIIEWRNIFSTDDFSELSDLIKKLRPYKLDRSKLSKNIILTDKLSTSWKSEDRIIVISKPIILNGFAVIKQHDYENELIIVATRSSGKWKTFCRKWVVLILSD